MAQPNKTKVDTAIRNPEVNDFTTFVQAHPSIRKICLNGEKTQQLFQRHCKSVLANPNIEVIALPFTSPANAKICYDEKCAIWRVAITGE